jgi:hypothetical protein
MPWSSAALDHRLVAHAGEPLQADPCSQPGSGHFAVMTTPGPQLWLVATHARSDDKERNLGSIYVDVHLEDGFAM